MSRPKQIIIKESLEDLKRLQRKSIPMISMRIRVLIEIKKSGDTGISKRALSSITGANHNSIQSWRVMYEQGGIEAILHHGRTGFKPALLSREEHAAVEAKLNNPTNGLKGYIELQQWVEQEFGKKILYNTLLKYCIRNFASKVKVARKSHVKKDEKAVAAFKKTSEG